jgi:hypothetical protein
VWTNPEVVAFSGKYQDLEPFLSPNGLRLYFSSNRPVSADTGKIKDFDIWIVDRKSVNDKWSEPINIGAPINTSANEFYPSISNFKNLYFTCENEHSKGKDDIFVSKWKDGKYETPVSMSDSINSEGMEFNAFVAPDESFLIYSCYNRKDGLGSGDLYISYNKGNDEWTKAQNLGASINCAKMDYCPFVNVKTGTLFFTARRNSVKTEFETKQNVNTLLKEMQKYENGLSRIYKVKLILSQ